MWIMAKELKQAVNRVPEEAKVLEDDQCQQQSSDAEGSIQFSVRPGFNQIPHPIGERGERDDNQSRPFIPVSHQSETNQTKIQGAEFPVWQSPIAQGGQQKDRK